MIYFKIIGAIPTTAVIRAKQNLLLLVILLLSQYNEEADKDSEIKMIEFFEKKLKLQWKFRPSSAQLEFII